MSSQRPLPADDPDDIYRLLSVIFLGQLTDLGERHLDVPFECPDDISDEESDWALIGATMVARMTECAYSLQHLIMPGLHLDAGTLLRSLFDHAVMLAWIGCDPDVRLERWRKHVYRHELVSESELTGLGGEADLPASRRALMTALLSDATVRPPPNLREICIDVDSRWELTGNRSYTTLYTVIFRQYSSVVHPTLDALSQHFHRAAGGSALIGLSNINHRLDAIGAQAPVIYGLGLSAASRSLGWPHQVDIDDVLDRYQAAVDVAPEALAERELRES